MRISLLRSLVILVAAGTLTGVGAASVLASPSRLGGQGSARVGTGGSAWAWGHNDFGQLGDGSTTDSAVPVMVQLPTATTVTEVSAGRFNSLALTSAGRVLAWGENHRGELGDGTKTDSAIPVSVKLPAGVKVIAIATGFGHSLAIAANGHVYAWGRNQRGQLGDGTTTDRHSPVRVHLPAGTKVTAVAAGAVYSLALTSTGRVLAWGLNHRGQLGIGVNTDRHVPVAVKLPRGTRVTGIDAGYSFSLAVTATGHALAWGSGPLGNGKRVGSNLPVRVKLPARTKVTAVAAGAAHGLVLTSASRVYAWGENTFGQLGNPSTLFAITPLRMHLPAGVKVKAIAGGCFDSLVLTRSGHILAFGPSLIAPQHGVKLPSGLIATAIARGSTACHALVVLRPQG